MAQDYNLLYVFHVRRCEERMGLHVSVYRSVTTTVA
jgi:hypothetical protein